jgi:hypothetical protein
MRFAACLRLSLDTLRLECPEAYQRVCDCLAPLTVALSLDGDPVTLAFRPGLIRIVPAGGPAAGRNGGRAGIQPDVQASTSRSTIIDLLEARSTIEDAILSDAILLRGRVGDLARFYDALLYYVCGAVRCPSFPAILAGYRSPGRRRRKGQTGNRLTVRPIDHHRDTKRLSSNGQVP